MSTGALEDVVDLFPRELDDERVRNRLRKFLRELDQLAVEDDGEVFVDRDVIRRVVREDGIFPPGLQDRVERDLEGHLGAKVKSKGKGRRLSWRELADRDIPLEPVPVEEFRRLGIASSTSAEEARRIFSEHFPDFPKEILDASGPQLEEMAVKGIQHNRTVWDCVVSKVGYWVALAVFAAFGALLIIGTATGPWGIPLAIFLAATLGGGTAVIVANCVLNPNM